MRRAQRGEGLRVRLMLQRFELFERVTPRLHHRLALGRAQMGPVWTLLRRAAGRRCGRRRLGERDPRRQQCDQGEEGECSLHGRIVT